VQNFVVGMDIINLFDKTTTINKNITQLQSDPSSSEADFYAGRVDFQAEATRPRRTRCSCR
jgi:hypothetical protein